MNSSYVCLFGCIENGLGEGVEVCAVAESLVTIWWIPIACNLVLERRLIYEDGVGEVIGSVEICIGPFWIHQHDRRSVNLG